MAGHGNTVVHAQHVWAFPVQGATTASPYARAARASHARHRPPRPARAAPAPPSESRGRTRLRLNASPRARQLARTYRVCLPRRLHCRHSGGIVNQEYCCPGQGRMMGARRSEVGPRDGSRQTAADDLDSTLEAPSGVSQRAVVGGHRQQDDRRDRQRRDARIGAEQDDHRHSRSAADLRPTRRGRPPAPLLPSEPAGQ